MANLGPDGDEWLTPVECARALKISVSTVYNLIERGRMPGPLRVGHQWRISRRALTTAIQVWEPLPPPADFSPAQQARLDRKDAARQVLWGRDCG